ncbi:MAG: NosD domain-containing protein [Promethearchaeota archaeon]
MGAENFFSSENGVVSTIPSKILPHASDYWENTSITIDATAEDHTTHTGNWTWAVAQDWCSGSGTVDQPYLIENMTFVADVDSNGLLINNSVGIYFTIQNCTFTNAISSSYAGLQLDNTDNGTIIGCNVSNNHRGIYFKENCNYNTVAFNDVNISSYVGIDIINNCNYNNISYNTVNHTDSSSYYYGQGIYLRNDCNNNSIMYNILSANDEGIKLSSNCNNNQIKENQIFKSYNDYGIYILSSTNNEIQYNLVDDNQYGIYIHDADENEISFNTIQNNEKDGIRLYLADNNTIFNNTLDNNSLSRLSNFAGIVLGSSHFNNVFNNTAFQSNFYMLSASNNTIVDNTFIRGGSIRANGMYLNDDSDNNSLIHNTIIGYPFNIKTRDSRGNQLIDNTLIDGTSSGFELSSSYNSTLTGNVIINSGIGIEVSSSNNITISENQITGSSQSDITLSRGDYHILTENTMENKGMDIEDIYHNQIDTSNTVGGKSIYYFEDQDNMYLDGNIMTDLAQLFVINSTNSTITNFDIHQKSIGLYFDHCASLNILNNNVSENLGDGLRLIGVNDSSIDSNIFDNNNIGIYYSGEEAPTFEDENPDFDLLSGNNVYSNNSICHNRAEGIIGEYGHHDNFSSNIIMHNGYSGIYFYYPEYFAFVTDNIISNNSQEGIVLSESMNCSIGDNVIQFNLDAGIYLDGSSNTTIHANQISENELGGILIDDSYGCDILENELIGNFDFGLSCEDADDTIISGNRIKATNGTGVYLDSDSGVNVIYNNDFIDNILHAEDNGTLNEWFLGTVGNYWDNYTGTDGDGNDIGDQPYNISGSAGSQDDYPIVDHLGPAVEAGDNCLINGDDLYTISWIVADVHPDLYNLTRDGAVIVSPTSWTNGTILFDIVAGSLTDGTHTFTLWLNDSSGNQNSASILVTVDSIAPTITSPENLTISPDSSSVLVNWTLTDLHPGEYSISFNGTVVVPFTAWTNGVITYNLNNTDLPPGNYTLVITVRDLVGNENTYEIIIVIKEEVQPGNAGMVIAIVILGVGIAGIAGFVIYRSKRG